MKSRFSKIIKIFVSIMISSTIFMTPLSVYALDDINNKMNDSLILKEDEANSIIPKLLSVRIEFDSSINRNNKPSDVHIFVYKTKVGSTDRELVNNVNTDDNHFCIRDIFFYYSPIAEKLDSYSYDAELSSNGHSGVDMTGIYIVNQYQDGNILRVVLGYKAPSVDPTPSPDPTEDPGNPNPTEDPGNPNPTEDPGNPNPTDDPGKPNPTEDPGNPNPTDDPGKPNPTEDPGNPNPTDDPSKPNPTDVPEPTPSSKPEEIIPVEPEVTATPSPRPTPTADAEEDDTLVNDEDKNDLTPTPEVSEEVQVDEQVTPEAGRRDNRLAVYYALMTMGVVTLSAAYVVMQNALKFQVSAQANGDGSSSLNMTRSVFVGSKDPSGIASSISFEDGAAIVLENKVERSKIPGFATVSMVAIVNKNSKVLWDVDGKKKEIKGNKFV